MSTAIPAGSDRFVAQFVPVADPAAGPTPAEWQAISRELRKPLHPDTLDIMLDFHSTPHRGAGGAMVQDAVVYVSRAGVQDRLDDVVGPGAWSGDFESVVLDREIRLAKTWISVYGQGLKADVGAESKQSNSMGAVSHGWRRAGDCWGVGRYLRYLPKLEVELEEAYKTKDGKTVYRISQRAEKILRAQLAAWDGRPGTFPTAEEVIAAAREAKQQQTPAAVATAPAVAPAPAVAAAQAFVQRAVGLPVVADDEVPEFEYHVSEEGVGDGVGAEEYELEAAAASASMLDKPGYITTQQLASIKKMWEAARPGKPLPADIEQWSNEKAGKGITQLTGEWQAARRKAQPQPAGAR